MTDPKPATVAVSVEDMRQIADTLHAFGSDEALALTRSYLPEPRLVAVDLDALHARTGWGALEWIESQSDLLNLLDDAIAIYPGDVNIAAREGLKLAIRTALGVDQ